MNNANPCPVSPEQGGPGNEVDTKTLWGVLSLLILAGVMTFLAAAVVFAHYGDAFLARRYDSVGEVLMREGGRLEDAGLSDAALEKYAVALKASFAGEFNRTHTLKRMGTILWRRGDLEAALTPLQQAVSGPHGDGGAYYALVDCFIKLNRFDEAEQALEEWLAWIGQKNMPREAGNVFFFKGRIAESRNDLAAAIAHYEKGDAIYHGDGNALRLARIYADMGDREKAQHYLQRCLERGASGKRQEDLLKLQRELLTQPGS